MEYQVVGGNFPVVICKLQSGESMKCQSGAMTWMDPEIQMETKSGGIGKMLGRLVSGENLVENRYIANGNGEIAFGASFPGEILAIDLSGGRSVIAQKGSFLACTEGVETSVFFQKKLSGGLFGGEGFVMQKYTGNGTVFIEIGGGTQEYTLEAGQKKIIDTGYLVCMDDTCSMDIQTISGVANVVFGGEGLFNTVLTGPGKIILQTMPETGFISKIASQVAQMLPNK